MDSPAHASEDLGVTRLENTCRQYAFTSSLSRSAMSLFLIIVTSICPSTFCRKEYVNLSPSVGSMYSHCSLMLAFQLGSVNRCASYLSLPFTLCHDFHQRNSCPTCRRPLIDPLPEESEETLAAAQLSEDHPHAAAQIADEVVQEVLEVLGMVNAGVSDQVDSVRRLVDSLLPDHFQSEVPVPGTDDHNYPDRSEFGMYS